MNITVDIVLASLSAVAAAAYVVLWRSKKALRGEIDKLERQRTPHRAALIHDADVRSLVKNDNMADLMVIIGKKEVGIKDVDSKKAVSVRKVSSAVDEQTGETIGFDPVVCITITDEEGEQMVATIGSRSEAEIVMFELLCATLSAWSNEDYDPSTSAAEFMYDLRRRLK